MDVNVSKTEKTITLHSVGSEEDDLSEENISDYEEQTNILESLFLQLLQG
ncbi:hypothetical protein Fmac_025415 [Flemingia macrophylla]|uniref:Uncharacterized protein n=1 Tax=Flemingia macrophylla TaxID=520843 RepID=A0ABD1LS55_9FABA